MRDYHLRFAVMTDWLLEYAEHEHGVWYQNPNYSMFDLLEGDAGELPRAPSAYVIGTADNTSLTYPWGTSPIYYIGQSEDLSKRIGNHAEWARQARDDHSREWWLPSYQYAGAFGGQVVWWLAKEGASQKNLEVALINAFYLAYGAIPAANRNWPNYRPPPKGDPEP